MEEVETDIRLVSATSEDLEKAIAEGRFREDLFHRLNEFTLQVPLLAECPEDIIPLGEFMLEAANRELDMDLPTCRKQEEYALNDEQTERGAIVKALEATGNNRKETARLLGISYSALYLKLKKYRLR